MARKCEDIVEAKPLWAKALVLSFKLPRHGSNTRVQLFVIPLFGHSCSPEGVKQLCAKNRVLRIPRARRTRPAAPASSKWRQPPPLTCGELYLPA